MARAMWAERALPYLRDKAAPFDDLRAAIAADAEQAGAKYGYRARGAGLAWHYVATVAGTVLQADTGAVFPVLRLDTDADGQPDAELQCGPIFENTSLRDALPFVSFATFDNQVAWGEFGVALNDLAYANAGRAACAGVAPGKAVKVLATFTRERGGRLPLLTPVLLEGGMK
jgi:predicted lipoprotein